MVRFHDARLDKKGRISLFGHKNNVELHDIVPVSIQAKAQHQVAVYMLQAFVKKKGEKHIDIMFRELKDFIEGAGPTIEDMHQRLKIRNAMPYGKVTGDVLEKSLRYEIDDAKEGWLLYRQIVNKLSAQLELMLDAKYSVQQFLHDEYGINVNHSALFAADLQLQWSATYGLLLDRLKMIVGKLVSMQWFLEKQIAMYHDLESPTSFIHAIHEEEEIHGFFKQERDAFKRVVDLTKMSTNEVGHISNVLAAQAHHLKQMLVTHVHIIHTGVAEDLAQSEDKIEKALVIFGFVLQAAVIAVNVQSNILQKIVGVGTGSAAKKLGLLAKDSNGLLAKLTGDRRTSLRYVKEFVKALDHVPGFV